MCARASRREKPAFLKRLDTRTKGDDTGRNSAQFRECRPHHCSRGAGLPFLLPDLPFGGRVVPGMHGDQTDYDECMALPRYNLTRRTTDGVLLMDMADIAPGNDPNWLDFVEFPQWTYPQFGTFDNMVSVRRSAPGVRPVASASGAEVRWRPMAVNGSQWRPTAP